MTRTYYNGDTVSYQGKMETIRLTMGTVAILASDREWKPVPTSDLMLVMPGLERIAIELTNLECTMDDEGYNVKSGNIVIEGSDTLMNALIDAWQIFDSQRAELN